MNARLTDYRAWVLRHWEVAGWCVVPDRVRTKKGMLDVRRLVAGGHLEKEAEDAWRTPENHLYRITDAGAEALAAHKN